MSLHINITLPLLLMVVLPQTFQVYFHLYCLIGGVQVIIYFYSCNVENSGPTKSWGSFCNFLLTEKEVLLKDKFLPNILSQCEYTHRCIDDKFDKFSMVPFLLHLQLVSCSVLTILSCFVEQIKLCYRKRLVIYSNFIYSNWKIKYISTSKKIIGIILRQWIQFWIWKTGNEKHQFYAINVKITSFN